MFESSFSRGGLPDPPEICVIRVSPLLAGTEAGPTKKIDRHTGRVRLRRTRSVVRQAHHPERSRRGIQLSILFSRFRTVALRLPE